MTVRQKLAFALMPLALAGCVNVLPKPTVPVALIELPPDRAKAPGKPLQADVAVLAPDSSRAYSGVDIAVKDQQEMVYLPEVRLADTAPRLLQGALVESLAKAGGPGRAAPAQMGANSDYDLRWRIIDLSTGREAEPVHAVVEASLLDSATRRIVAQQRFDVPQNPGSKKPRDRAAALALAMQGAADQVAAFVVDNAAPKPMLAGAPGSPS